MSIIHNRKIFFTITGLLMLGSVAVLSVFGLNLGIDFTGGSLLEVRYEMERPDKSLVDSELSRLELSEYSLRESGEESYIVRLPAVSDEGKEAVISALTINSDSPPVVERFNEIGPTIGAELRNKAYIAIVIVVMVIIFFVAFVFRNVRDQETDRDVKNRDLQASASKPKDSDSSQAGVSSWTYGLVAIAALIHDILIPVGVFSLLGYFIGVEVNQLFVMALLAILGFSVNDTIVVFDRVRENLQINRLNKKEESFEETVDRSVSQSYARSINTSLTTLLVLFTLFIIGAESMKWFVLTLIIGVAAGTYSSLCFAAPLLVYAAQRRSRK